MTLTTHKMGSRHEEHLAETLEGRKTKGSGNKFNDQGDGKQQYAEEEYVFCWDGKSTLGKSVSVTREMWAKIQEQSHWATPAIPIRFYGDERLTKVDADLILVDLEVFAAMQRDANAFHRVQSCLAGYHIFEAPGDCSICGTPVTNMANYEC